MQTEKPAYQSGPSDWWGEVINRTAIGAGADPQGWSLSTLRIVALRERHGTVVGRFLGQIVPRLLHRFSSKEGYKLFDDSLPCCVYAFNCPHIRRPCLFTLPQQYNNSRR